LEALSRLDLLATILPMSPDRCERPGILGETLERAMGFEPTTLTLAT
jgi:hypothetical protein